MTREQTASPPNTRRLGSQRQRCLLWTLCATALWLAGCAGPRYTVDDGRPVNPELLARIEAWGAGERTLRPAIARTAELKDKDCDRQWELPFSVNSSVGWEENDRVAWVRALGVDERLTVVGTSAQAGLQLGERLMEVDGYTSRDPAKLSEELAKMRDRGRPFPVKTATGKTITVTPLQVCRGYTRLAPPNTPELQDYHWLMSYHPLEITKADLTPDEALWTVLWTQGVSEEGGARMKTYHYGTSILSSLYTVATIATGLKGAAMAAEAAVATAQKAAASVASDLIKQQLIDQAKQFATNRVRDELSKAAQSLTQAQVVASMQMVAANKGMLGGISRVAATVFDDADTWAYHRMKALGADPLSVFSLHQKMLERGLLSNALVLDPDRLPALQTLAEKEGRGGDVTALLKGIRPESLDFDSGDMPLASATQEFSYEDPQPTDANPFAMGLVEGMLGIKGDTPSRK